MSQFTAIFRVIRFDGVDFPCVFFPDYPAGYGNLTVVDREGINAGSLDYYRATRPARPGPETAECEKLARYFDTIGPRSEHSTHVVRRRLNFGALREAWRT